MKKLSLTAWIFICLVLGIVLGITAPSIAVSLAPISNIFLRLIKSIVAPLLFGTLVVGIVGAGNLKTMGRIAGKAFAYFYFATTIALFIGLGAVNLIRPGAGLNIERSAQVNVQKAPTFQEVLEHAFPTSVIDAMARGEVLQLVVFCILFGTAAAAIGPAARPVVHFAEALSEIMFKYTAYVMYLAPLGVGAAVAVTVGSKGIGVLVNLGKLVLTLYGALIIFVVFVIGGVLVFARIPLKRFIDAVREPWLIAFSTASSEAALPRAMENMERFGVPKSIVAFVMPTGYSFNLDGSTLYLSLASVFVAQAAGVEMPFGQQLLMMATLMLTSKGVAAVPRASLVVLAGTLTTFNLPVEGIAVILGVDAVLDMARTSVNVLGNCVACAVVARWEGHPLIEQTPQAPAVAVGS
jgi:proton glutamate symport protein